MKNHSALQRSHINHRRLTWILALVAVAAAIFSTPLLAQQTGEIVGRVSNAADNSALSGVTIEATSPVLPGARSSTTSNNGDYRLPLLPPGTYTIKFMVNDSTTLTRVTDVRLEQRSVVNLIVDLTADASYLEEVLVVGTSTIAPDTGGASLAGSIGTDTFEALPVGQEYRDLIKLIPGVQYTQDEIRGPSAGGSGQDNTYQFDGVDVSLPQYGTLSAEPSTHDIDQVSIVRGGAKAVGFNRSGGFKVNTTSKRGTNEFHGSASYQTEPADLSADRKNISEDFQQDKDWIVASLSGPIMKDKLFFYGSFYRPTVSRNNRDNVYGPVPDYKSTRDEWFGKLTWAPTDNLLFDASYRTSDREVTGEGVGAFEHPDGSSGSDTELNIAIVEGSWIINDNSNAYFKYTDYENKSTSRPDLILSVQPTIGGMLDLNNLDRMGHFQVPTLAPGDPIQNAWAQPLINQYGYGDPNGGGLVGAATDFNTQDFFRTSWEIGYDLTIETGSVTHELHAGYHQEKTSEYLVRSSNGWGFIDPIGGVETTSDGEPIFFQAQFFQTSLGEYGVPPIDTGSKSRNIEINDTIYWNNFSFNLGLLFSEDKLYGQGLKKNSSNVSGYELAPGNRYLMKKIDFGDMVQPRLGVTWDAKDNVSVFANYARYYPAATSLPRAAAWDRNLHSLIEADFDADGNMIEIAPRDSSSGKFFQEGIDPRHVDEYLIGVNWGVNDNLTTRAHFRYRGARNFWEDTPNTTKVAYACSTNPTLVGCMPEGWASEELYIPDLAEYRAEVGGSSYVIAQLERSYTDFYELSFEAEWQYEKFYLTASYTWSEYTGNFDQDNTSGANDANRFIGSSSIADGRGRNLWDFKDGTLRGDRTHQLKAYGYYDFDWNGTFGFYGMFQSGQPWETWYGRYYGFNSSTIRYVEPAGSRRSEGHFQLDLNYVHNFYLGGGDRYTIQLRADMFNVFNKQTGYNINPYFDQAGYGEPRSYFNPRRIQLMAKFLF